MLGKKNCVVCKIKSLTPLCRKCQKNPFRLEEYRSFLAERKDYLGLKKWYTRSLPEIPNLNTSKFWDQKLKINESLDKQDGMTKSRIRAIERLIDDGSKKILDIGAGHGFLEEYLISKRNLKISANDFSNESVDHLKQRFKGDFKVQSIYQLDYKNVKFDTVFTLEVLEHIPPSKILSVLKNVKTLIKPGGQFIVSVPTNEGLEKMKINHNGHLRLYTIPLISAELEIVGFNVEEIMTLYAFDSHYQVKSIIAKVYKKWKPNNIILSTRSV